LKLALASLIFMIPLISYASETVVIECSEKTILLDEATGNYSYADGGIIIYGDEENVKIVENSSENLLIISEDNNWRPPWSADGEPAFPYVINTIQIKINKVSGKGTVFTYDKGGEKTKYLTNCQ